MENRIKRLVSQLVDNRQKVYIELYLLGLSSKYSQVKTLVIEFLCQEIITDRRNRRRSKVACKLLKKFIKRYNFPVAPINIRNYEWRHRLWFRSHLGEFLLYKTNYFDQPTIEDLDEHLFILLPIERYNKALRIIRQFQRKGVDINQIMSEGTSILAKYARGYCWDVCSALIDCGANPCMNLEEFSYWEDDPVRIIDDINITADSQLLMKAIKRAASDTCY